MRDKFIALFQYKIVQYLLALMAGASLPLAFAPIGIFPLALIAPAILLSLWSNNTPKQAFWLGLTFGLGFFGIGASWVYISIHTYGNTAAPLAAFITLLFILTLSLYIAAQGYVLTRFFAQNSYAKLYLAFPGTWVLAEALRGWIGTGFPWLFLGASQSNSFLKGYAPIVGEFGVSFLVVLCSALLVTACSSERQRIKRSLIAIVIIWVLGLGLSFVHWTRTNGLPFSVALVQGNVPQQLKWTPDFLQPTLERYTKLSEPYWNSALIVWPEAAVPALAEDVKDFLEDLREEAAIHHTTFMLGVPVAEGFNYYNSLLLLHNNEQQFYYKRHLVPFGDYLPFAKLLRGLIGFFNIPMSSFSAGDDHQATLQFNNIKFAPFICYEIAFQREVLPELPGANLLVTINNDAWFGHSFASAQHLQIGQLRALETGRYHLFTSNSGRTAIIDPQGHLQATLPPDVMAVLSGNVQAMKGATPLVWWGGNSILISISLLVLLAYALQRRAQH